MRDDLKRKKRAWRWAFDAMPDDQEIAELLRDALIGRGNRLEAERIRLRTKEAAM